MSRRVAATHTQPADSSQPASADPSTERVDRIDWPTAQQNDPTVGEIYRLIRTGTPRPSPESVSDCSAEMKSLCAQYDRLRIT